MGLARAWASPGTLGEPARRCQTDLDSRCERLNFDGSVIRVPFCAEETDQTDVLGIGR